MFSICHDPQISRGSSLYYALLFTNRACMPDITVIHQLLHEIHSILHQTTEHHIAKLKLEWWLQEIQRVYAGNPQHPLSTRLANLVEGTQLPQQWLKDWINVHQEDISPSPLMTFMDFYRFCRKMGGTQCAIYSWILGTKDEQQIEFAFDVGSTFTMIHSIRYFRYHLNKGKLYFPQEDLLQLKLTQDALFEQKNSDLLALFLTKQALRAKEYYAKALLHFPQGTPPEQLPFMILGNIYLALLKEMEKEKFNVIKQKYSLTPLRKFWIAYCTARSLKTNR